MQTQNLLSELKKRGVFLNSDGAKIHLTAPRGALTDALRAEIRAHKPELLAILQHGNRFADAPETPETRQDKPAKWRRANDFVFVPLDFKAAPGAAAICGVLQRFELIFAAARGEFPDGGAAACQVEKQWSDRARKCQREQRALTVAESLALEAAAAWLGDLAQNPRSESRHSASDSTEVQPMAEPRDTRRAAVLRGQTVVANKNSDADLIEWAASQGLAVGIMRQNQWKNAKWASEWANPFPMKKAMSDRGDVCDRHAAHLAESPDLLARIGELGGKVLVCCCYPLRCHGDELARLANANEVNR